MISVFDGRDYLYTRSDKYSCNIQSYLQCDFDIITGCINYFRSLFAKCAPLQGAYAVLSVLMTSQVNSFNFLWSACWSVFAQKYVPCRVTFLNKNVVFHSYFVFILFYLFPQKANLGPFSERFRGPKQRPQPLASFFLWTVWTCLNFTVGPIETTRNCKYT